VAAVPRNWQPPPGVAHARQPRSAASSSVISPRAPDFGLRQVERIFPLDVAAAHVVADRVAENAAGAVQHEAEFGFGHLPGRVAAQADGLARADGPRRRRFEEQFRPLRPVHFVVHRFRGGAVRVRLFVARRLAALVGDPGRPHFRRFHGRKEPQPAPVAGHGRRPVRLAANRLKRRHAVPFGLPHQRHEIRRLQGHRPIVVIDRRQAHRPAVFFQIAYDPQSVHPARNLFDNVTNSIP